MLFADEELFAYVLTDLAKEVAASIAPPISLLPCDRWIARSALQKAIRRGEPALAMRALVNLFEHDRRSAWRSLGVIALEDVGVANIDILAKIVAAYQDRNWRKHVGGEWPVMAELVRQMAVSDHCQAACDLLLHATNDSALEHHRSAALEANPGINARSLWDSSVPLLERGIAALAMGGGLAEGQRHADPCAAFDILAESSRSTHVVATCRAAWKLTRNEMALLLPLVWEKWTANDRQELANDPVPPAQMINGVPGYALDQFTRLGNTISRALLRSDPVLREILSSADIPSARHPRAVGDLLFLIEGSCLASRTVWPVANALREPQRMLPTVAIAEPQIDGLLRHLRSKAHLIAQLRAEHISPKGPLRNL